MKSRLRRLSALALHGRLTVYMHRNRESLSQKAALNNSDFNWCLKQSADLIQCRYVSSTQPSYSKRTISKRQQRTGNRNSLLVGRSEPGCHACGSKQLDEVDQVGQCISVQATMDLLLQQCCLIVTGWKWADQEPRLTGAEVRASHGWRRADKGMWLAPLHVFVCYFGFNILFYCSFDFVNKMSF